MSSSENIKNAFSVVLKTYESVEKLMNFLDVEAEKNGYISVTNKFLRRKGDTSANWWLLQSFIKVYQRKKYSEKIDNHYINGPVYTVEFNFEQAPIYRISKFEYEDISKWEKIVSPADHWGFYYPTKEGDSRIQFSNIEDGYVVSVPKGDYKKTYWGLNKATFKSFDLINLNSSNAEELIFGGFDKLKDKV